jgi:hypothetical protein
MDVLYEEYNLILIKIKLALTNEEKDFLKRKLEYLMKEIDIRKAHR